MKKQIKIGIIANCQGTYLQTALSRVAEEVILLPIHLYNHSFFQQKAEAFNQLEKNPEAIIITQILVNKHFGKYITEKYENNNDVKAKIVKIPNLYFDGLHPDITYVGNLTKRFHSPMGDYHSKIILMNYFLGKNTTECLNSFNFQTYDRLNYFGYFQKAHKTFLEKEKNTDIQIGDILLDNLQQKVLFFTLNHPVVFLLEILTARICELLKIDYYKLPQEYLSDDTIVHGPWWPIYPEIAKHNNLQFDIPFIFKQAKNIGNKILTLEEFIKKSYHLYDSEKEDLILTPQVQNLLNNQLVLDS